ncbi:eukaryotic elongation factor 2 kinase-like [Penaeus japonicus]|uniref:eukaryotic elongation factor 2 kinase-like n=1 Tax=Penaeus japonicus TaxID=27405 RepID=UPI001C710FEC|nr:eukaryotic elongation factor 2 kinase-like [Penaeus japonicus]
MANRKGAPAFGDKEREYQRQSNFSDAMLKRALNMSKACQTTDTKDTKDTSKTSHASQKCEKDAEFKYLIEAAKSEDCAAMIIVARAFNTGVGLPPSREKNWVKAVYWLEKAVSAKSEDEGDFNSPVDDPSYHLVAEEATMYLNGGYGLAKDAKKAGELFNWAAELATGAKKDSLASEYYMQAKEAWQCVNQRGKKKRN